MQSLEAFSAVALGAILATLGGFLSGRASEWLHRRDQSRAAATLCGEVLSALDEILEFAVEAHRRDDPFGPLTMRLLRAARREIDVYDRNRECMFRINDRQLRARIHSLMVRMAIPLDRLEEEGAQRLAAARSPGGDDALDASSLHQTFAYLIESRRPIANLLDKLRPLARDRFKAYSDLRVDRSAIIAGDAAP